VKYKERDALVASLREAADFFESKGLELPFDVGVSMSAWTPTYSRKTYGKVDARVSKHLLKKAVRAMKPVQKKYTAGSLHVIRKFGTLEFTLFASRDIACRAVPTGNKIIHAASHTPEWTEDEIEWVCTDPLLKETA
jgi:hypothetical protein